LGSGTASTPATTTSTTPTSTKIVNGIKTGLTISGDILTDVMNGVVAVSDAQTALHSAQQTMGGHGVSLNNIGTYAQAEQSAANTTGLGTAINTLTTDIQNQLSAGVSQSAITTQLTAAQLAVSAVAPVVQPAAATTDNTLSF
jgi:hypothetical protein